MVKSRLAERTSQEKQRFKGKCKKDTLSSYGVKQLRILASKKKVAGRSKMTKCDLITQLLPSLKDGDLPFREPAVNTPTRPRKINFQEEYQHRGKGKGKTSGRQMINHHHSSSGSPSTKNLSGNNESELVFCVIDLETTSLKYPDLTQISAQTLDGKRTFNEYILPNKPIDSQASKITGIKKVNNQLVVRGKIAKTFLIHKALMMFSGWLDSLGADIILVGHNIRKFDMVHLLRHARAQKLTSLFHRVVGTLDTALLFANLHPSAKPHTLEKMYKMFFGTNFEGAHGAVEDCRAVARILNEGGISVAKKKQFIQAYSF